MNIDIECSGLLALILQDSPKDRQYILCVLARSNSIPTRIHYDPKFEYPTFYVYSNSRIPFYLMGEGVLSNVPRKGYGKRLISSNYLSYAETVINKAKNSNVHQMLESVSKFIVLENKTAYSEAQTYLVFRDKALQFIHSYGLQNRDKVSSFLRPGLSKEDFGDKSGNSEAVSLEQDQKKPLQKTPEWSENFRWEGKSLVFGEYGKLVFNSKETIAIFKELFNAKGGWVGLKKLRDITGKDKKSYIRPTIGQVQRRMTSKLKQYISIPSTRLDDLEPKPQDGAYRIKYSPKSQL